MSHTRYKNIAGIFSKNKYIILYIFILDFLLLIPAALAPIFKRVFTDYILTDGFTEWLAPLVILMLGISVLFTFVTWMKKSYLLRLSNQIELSGDGRYIWSLLCSPLSLFQKRDSYRLLYQADASRRISKLLTQDLLELFFNVISVILYLVMMLRVDFLMSAVVVALVAVNLIMSKLQEHLRVKLSPKNQPAPDASALAAQDERIISLGLENIETFKATASETHFFQRLLDSKISIINAKQNKDVSDAYRPVETFPGTVFLNLLLLISALRVMDHTFTVGSYLAFQAYATAFFIPISSALNARKSLRTAEKQLGRLYQELDNGEGARTKENIYEEAIGKLNGYIELKNVCFGYESGEPVLQNISLSVMPGQRVAILGNSGAGKTTLFKLLQGIYEPDSGEILIDGICPAHMDKRLLANSIGCANQEITLFSASMRDNITLWDESVSDAEIYRAASDACIHEHIASLNGAYDYQLSGDGSSLSGDYRQRLEISRALLYNPSVVLLDEVIGSIDSMNRAVIEQNLVKRGCTCVCVTHMPSRIMDYDEIILMENGQIVQRGTHDELMRSSSLYASMLRDERAVIGV